jgi:hypothetical protein
MKNVILASVLFTAFASCNTIITFHGGGDSNPVQRIVYQTNPFSDALNTTGALTCAAIKPLLSVGAFCMYLNSISTALDGDFGGTLASLCGFGFLGFWAEQLGNNQKLCTDYTSAQVKPFSKALQTVTSISTAVIALGCWGMILQELQKA